MISSDSLFTSVLTLTSVRVAPDPPEPKDGGLGKGGTGVPPSAAPGIARLRIAALAVGLLATGAAAQDVRPIALPQDHAYQVVLRDYLATLSEADFELAVAPITFDETWVETDEALHRLWTLTRYHHRMGTIVPQALGLTIAADNFLLNRIESEEGIRMRAGHRGGQRIPGIGIHPADTAWWALWDYPGNPYFSSRAVLNRAFTVAAVDMMMLDHLHESGTHWVNNARRSDFLGGTLIWLGYVYGAVREDIPAAVREAYETGLAKLVQRLTDWGPTAVCDNMDMKANVGLAYVAAALEDGPVVDQARAYIERNLRLVHAAGMIRDAQGLDATYNGIALVNIVWAALKSDWPEFRDPLNRISELKAYLTLPEPDGENFFGPSHFNTRTSADSANDQWVQPYRDIGVAMLSDDALFLMAGGRRGRDLHWAAPERDVMLDQVRRGIERLNGSLQPSDQGFTEWQAGWWPGTINYAHDYYREGFHERLRELYEARDPRLLPPFSRPDTTFVRAFPDPEREDVEARDRDAFVVARFAEYGAVIYTGPIGRTRYMNFAGGALSAFWTPSGGSILLGRTGQPVNPERSRQTWADWRLWPTHALSGATPSGDAFSTARVRRRVASVDYDIGGDSAVVTFGGPLGKPHDDSRTAQNGCIAGDVHYQRRFEITESGVAIETRLTSDGSDQVTELLEILPLFLREARAQDEVPHRVLFQVGDTVIDATEMFIGATIPSPTTPADQTEASADDADGLLAGIVVPDDAFVGDVTAVRIERFDGSAVIHFESPQRVRLAGEIWTDTYQTRASLWNLLIDLLDNRGEPVPLPDVTLRYRIEPGPNERPQKEAP